MREFLDLEHWPAAMSVEYVSYVLGWSENEVHILIRAGILPYLGSSDGSERKDIHTAELLELIADKKWMTKARNCLIAHWRQKNSSRVLRQNGSAKSHGSASAPKNNHPDYSDTQGKKNSNIPKLN